MKLFARLAGTATLAACLLPFSAQAQYSTPMRNVDNPDRFPYQESVSFTISPPYVNGFAFFPTPLGKRYVIEYVSLNCNTPSGSDTMPQVYLYVTRAGSAYPYVTLPLAPMVRTGTGVFGSGFVWVGQTQLKAYSDPVTSAPDGGNGIFLNIFHTESTQTVACTIALTGHAVTP